MSRFCPLQCMKSTKNNAEKIAVLILNMDLGCDISPPIFHHLWDKAVFRACADGGANFVYDVIQKGTNGNRTKHMPDLISGDFDSIRPEAKQFYENQNGISIVHTPDQDATDFTKSLKLIFEKIHQKLIDVNLIVALGGKQDRFDHSMANISTLFQAANFLPQHVRICLMFGSSYVCSLPKGKSIIEVNTGLEGDWCGLIPIGNPVNLTTTGLKWNLTNDKLEFGELISTSNELDGSNEVTVETDHPLIWTLAFKTLHSDT
uniref:thiamin pyrophosphokinase 1-like n=1 Tax=Styela clava TaxID=7725 RepID=UPI0019394CCF|nr:thiamin pyrophosphokinase 1-like [Styela clava]